MTPFYYTIKEDGFSLLDDVEAYCETSVDLVGGEIVVTVDSVWIEGYRGPLGAREKRMFNLAETGDALLIALGRDIATAAQADEDFCTQAAELEGLTYRTRGGNDPEARWAA